MKSVAQAAMFPLRIAVAINSGKRSGVHAKLGTPSADICAANFSALNEARTAPKILE